MTTIDTVALLLADPSPSLRLRALVEVDGAAADDAEVVALRAQVPAAAHAAATAEWPWFRLCQLAYLGLTRGDAVVDSLAESVFAAQKKDGSWPVAGWAGRARGAPEEEGYQWRPLQTALPLRGLCAAGFADDPRAEAAFGWLLEKRFDDGSWPYGFAAGRKGFVAGYRRLPRSEGCRATTTGALACLAHHPVRRVSEDARVAVDLLLQRETRDEWTLGFEVARLVGVEPARGLATFYGRFDLAFVLDLAARVGVSADDVRVADLISFLESKRGPYGLWDHPIHPHLSKWLTLDVLSSLRRLSSGENDFVGSDLRVAFRAYPKRRRRS